jgi:hypothetical protein
VTALSPEEIRLKVLNHFAEFISKLLDENDKDACFDFASTMLDAVDLQAQSIDDNGVIVATMKLVPLDELLADFPL